MNMKTWIAIMSAATLALAIYSAVAPDDRPASPRALGARDAALAVPRSAERPPLAPAPRMPMPSGAPLEITRGASEPEPNATMNSKPAPSATEARDRFEAYFAAEVVDTGWSRGAADTLTSGIQAVLPAGSNLLRLECRGTLCRVETSHLDVDGFRTFSQHAFLDRETRVGSSGFFASLLGDPAQDGPVTAVAYLAREGKALPGPEALFAAP
jgi:hypothetical protein